MNERVFNVSQQVVNDLEGVVDASTLGPEQRFRLRAIVIGAIPGNRDLPLYLLAKAVAKYLAAGSASRKPSVLFDILSSGHDHREERIGPLNLALLNFLSSMDGYRYFETISSAVDRLATAPLDPSSLKGFTSTLAGCLYHYRTDHLPTERHRSQFNDIRQFFSAHRPQDGAPRDGDALEFWCQEADRSRWTLYETALRSMTSYSEALEIARLGEPPMSIDDDGVAAQAEQADTPFYGSLDDILDEAISALEGSPLKIFKQKELGDLSRFGRLGRHALGWAQSSLTLFAFAPFQGSLVQLERQGDPGERRAELAACRDASTYAEIRDRMASCTAMAEDCLALAASLSQGQHGNDNASGCSIHQGNPSARVTAMMRRKSFSGFEPHELRELLEPIEPALATVAGALARLVRSWTARLQASSDGGFGEDRQRFATKLASLYLRKASAADGI
jgi:hypothetical protein